MREIRTRLKRLEEQDGLEPMVVLFVAENGAETVGTVKDMERCGGVFRKIISGGDSIGQELLQYIWKCWDES